MASSAAYRLPPLPSLREIIRLYKLHAKKQLSQNFLLDMNLTRKIVRCAGIVGKKLDGHIVEVGPGPGGITQALLETGVKHLSVVEIDKRFLPVLELLKDASLKDQMSIHQADILKFDMSNLFDECLRKEWDKSPPNIHIIGNLPFNVSTPLIINWLEQISNKEGPWRYGRVRLTLTFQKEIAERMVAPILNDQRSRLSVMSQYLCKVNHKFTIPGKAFVPAPDVDVGVVHFVPHKSPLIKVPYKYVDKVVRHVFQFRQKKCKHGLLTLFPPDKWNLADKLIEIADIDPATRSFALTMEEYDRLCIAYKQICDDNPGLMEYYFRSQSNSIEWRTPKITFPSWHG